MGLTQRACPPIMSGMMKRSLSLLLLGLLLLTPACRHHHRGGRTVPHSAHEEATPVSNLPSEEFSRVTPQHGRH